MSCRMTASSKPTVLTQYPLAQKCSPVKLRLHPRYSRCMRMAAFPFNRPTAFATLYLGGMRRRRCTCSGMALDQFDAHLLAEFSQDLPNVLAECAKDCFLSILRYDDD